MIPLTAVDMQVLIATTVFVLGAMSIVFGTLVLIRRGYSKEIKALAYHTARLGQKGLAEDVSGLVNSASELVTALNQLVRTSSGAGLFLVVVGTMMIGGAYWIVINIDWAVA